MLQYLHMKHIPLVIGNWKMNPQDPATAKQLYMSIKSFAKRATHASVVVAPPIIFIPELFRLSLRSNIALAAQNIYPADGGAHTGEHSIPQLVSYGVQYSIVGHSERRAMGETNDSVAEKVQALLKARLTPIICVGERTRDDNGDFFSFIEAQISTVLTAVPKTRYKELVFAYEPIWAIGTGQTATVDDVVEMRLFITKTMLKHCSKNAASQIRVLYGGSVNAGNARLLYESGAVNGFLVGGASLKPEEFKIIINATK